MHFKMSPAICLNLDQSKILSSGNGFKTVFSDDAKVIESGLHYPFPNKPLCLRPARVAHW